MSTQKRIQKTLSDLSLLPGNNICADCKARTPRWASYNLGIFICGNCVNIHRRIGAHITKVKSLTLDDWTKDQVEVMQSMGNINSNRIYNPDEIRNPPPPNLEVSERDSDIELYIRDKYQHKRFLNKSALVVSKLGPSRTAPLAQPSPFPQPASYPQPASLSQSASLPHTQTTKPYAAASTASTSPYAGPPKPPQVLPTTQQPQPAGGIWNDINSLKGTNQNSSLPLQYQQPAYSQAMQLPAANSAIGANVYPVGANPYQPNEIRMNPFSQQQSQPPFVASSMTSSFSTTPKTNSQPFGQQSFGVPQSSASMVHQPANFHSQPQTSMQIQNPSGQGFISASSSSQLFPSGPAGQPPFLPQSHSSTQQQYIQQMQSSSTPQFMYSNPAPAQPQMGGHGQFLGTTTMPMQQQARQQQQQMQMQQPQIQQQHQKIQQQPQIQQQQHQQQIQQQHQQQQMQQQHQHQQQMQQQQQQMQQQQQQLGQNYFSPIQPHMMSGQVKSVYGQPSPYPQGGYPPYPPQTGGQWGTR